MYPKTVNQTQFLFTMNSLLMKNIKSEPKRRYRATKISDPVGKQQENHTTNFRESKNYGNSCCKELMYLPRFTVYSCTRVPTGGRCTVFTE